MKILSLRNLEGPNVYHPAPVLVMKVDLQEWVDRPSRSIPGFNQKLLELLPGLHDHHCSPGYAGGFQERLETGTYLAHIIEHVALELSEQAGIGVFFGKSRYCGQNSQYEIATRYRNEAGMSMCLRRAFQLVKTIIDQGVFDLQQSLNEIRDEVERTKLGPTTEALLNAAIKKGIPVKTLGPSLIQFGYGKNRRRIQTAVTDRTSLIAADLVQDKDLTKKILCEHMIPVPAGRRLDSLSELEEALTEMAPPYAIKPLDGHHGHGVCLNLQNRVEAIAAYRNAASFGSSVLIEEMCPGRDYRILVVGHRFIAAAERRPPEVHGDGKTKLRDLIEGLNRDPRRGDGHAGVLSKIEIDESLLQCLKKQVLHLDSVPYQAQRVQLRANANLSGGGTATDVTALVHPKVRVMCERISRIVDLDVCGIDLIHRDISEPVNEFAKVIEVNAAPGLRMHLAPSEGEARPVAEEILEMMFPNGARGRIPIVSVTGTNGKTTVVRLIRRILKQDGHTRVGMTTTDGIWIGDDEVATGDTTGPQSAQTVLSDPSVDVAVLETARGGILRRGLGYDWADVGIITNIRPDHIGQDGIEDIEDLVWIKSLVAERVREGGTIILNADDEECLRLLDNPRIQREDRKIVLYSTRSQNPNLILHASRGGEAYFCESGILFQQKDGEKIPLAATTDFQVTMRGKADFQVSNVLAAIAAGFNMGATRDQICLALRAFNPTIENRGRTNLYRIGEGFVLLDYGHNPDAIVATGEMVANWKGHRKTVVFGLPGDRADDLLRDSALKIAPFFERFLLRDDFDLRGREPGEVPRLIAETLREANPEAEIEIMPGEIEAMEKAFAGIRKDELVTVFYDEFEPTMKLIRQFDPVPADSSAIPEESPFPGIEFEEDNEDRFLLAAVRGRIG